MSAIILFEEKQVRRAWSQSEEKWYFAIVDVLAVLTESPNPQVYWRVLKKRMKAEGNETVTNCNALKMTAADGKQRLTELEEKSGTRVSTPGNFKTLPERQARALRNQKPNQ
ncbi:MAG: hypothetical protein WC205_08945 [Opitutaceae bacterium]|jgi:hypothetical protein